MKKLMVPAAMLAAMVMAVSCDKNNDKPVTTLSKIQAKWKVSSVKLASGDGDSTYTGAAADYVDFRTDGKVYTNVANEKDTSLYSVVNDTKLVVDGDTAIIKQLSSSQFMFEYKQAIAQDTLTTTFSLNK